MVNASNAQYDFRGGEWSPLAQGRMDDPRYKTGMVRCFNSYPVEEGAWTRRSGTHHARPTRRGAAARLSVFDFSESQPYNLELSSGHLRFFNGRTLVYDEVQPVVSISTATPAVLSIAAVTWATDDDVYFVGQDTASIFALPLLANRTFTLARLTTSTFALYDGVTGAPIDGSTLGWSGQNVTVQRVKDIATPYTNGEWSTLRLVQADTAALMLSGSVKPYVLSVTAAPSANSFATFGFGAQDFVDGPYLDPVPGSTITPAQSKGLIDLSISFQAYSATQAYSKDEYVLSSGIGYKSLVSANVNHLPASSPTYWTVVSPGAAVNTNGFVSTDVGRVIRLYNATAAPAWSGATTYDKGDIISVSSINYRSLVTNNLNQAPASQPLFWEVYSPGWTWGRIVALSTTGLISPTGFPNIGTLVQGGGLAAAFDGTLAKNAANSASLLNVLAPLYGNALNSVGKDYTGTPKAVSSVVVTPSTSNGFAAPYINSYVSQVTINLRGKNTAPSSSSDGTLLATATVLPTQLTPVTLTSTDQVTTWNYVWVETNVAIGGFDPGQNIGAATYIAQVQIYGSGGLPGVGVQVQLIGPQLPNTTTMTTWRLGAYSDTTGWPKCGCYHEGRLWLAGAIPNRFDASRSNSSYDFTPTNGAGVVGDSNAITGTFNSSDINSIFWMMPDLQGIVCGTQAGEWLIQASAANNPLTPASIQAHRVTKYGCANVEPKRTGLTTMFVQKFGRRLHEYLSDIFSGRFFAPNATERAKHLTNSGVLELAYQEELTPIVWSRMGDGTFAGTTYRRVSMSSSAEPVFNGWHNHVLGSARVVESMVVGPSADGNLDSLAMITNEAETGIRHVEIMKTMFDEDNVLTDAWFLDNAVAPSAITSTTLSGAPALRLFGLWHLNGKTVVACIGGLDCGDYVVTDGYITVPYSSNPLLTTAYLASLSTAGEDYGDRAVSVDAGNWTIPAVVGFTFTSQGQVLRPNTPETTGARQGPGFGKVRRGQKYAALFHNAQGVSVGTRFDKLELVQFKDAAGNRLTKDVLFSGMHKDTLADDYSMNGMLAWEVSRPYPATIAAIGEMLATQDE